MKSQEAVDLGRLAGTELRHATSLVRGAHSAISDTVHDALRVGLGPVATPVQVAHDAVAGLAYAATGLGVDVAARVAGVVAGQRLRARDTERTSLHDAPRGHQALAVGLGIRGDHVHARMPSLAPTMHIRSAGRAVPLTAEGVRTAYEAPTGEVALFLHGLCETEASWRLGAERRRPYADRLAADLGLTPVLVRYNTGLRISENGQALAGLLEGLVVAWPVPVTRIVLIGHSMGGLVVHSALAQAPPQAAWLPLVSDTIGLGSPHHGSPVARSVHRAAEALATSGKGAWLGDYLRRRSVGVRDLAHGNVVPADWEGHSPDSLQDRRTHPPALAGVRHHAVIAVLGSHPRRAVEQVGDLLVPVDSARHLARDDVPSRFEEERVAVITGLHHLGLLNDERVHGHLLRWLGEPLEATEGAQVSPSRRSGPPR